MKRKKRSKICTYDGGYDIWLGYHHTMTMRDAKKRAPSRMVCPICGRKLKPRIQECHDPGCWHASVPVGHKKKGWWK